MTNKKLKLALIISIAFLSVGFLFIQSTKAMVNPLMVNFESKPLFNEANFLPGDNITRYIEVSNYSGQEQTIIIEAINFISPIPSDDLSRALIVTIKEGINVLYGPEPLSDFYEEGEFELSKLQTGDTTQYNVTINFPLEKSKEWQGTTTGFDVLVGFKGIEEITETSELETSRSGGNPLPLALTIYSEANVTTNDTSVTITWITSYAATSQVIYGTATEAHTLNLSDNLRVPPLYGYAHTTPETDSGRVINHSVTISGLTPGTTYYYRAVSHGSLAIGQEFTFTTSGIQPINSETEQGATTEETGEVAGLFMERNLSEENTNGEELVSTEQGQETEELNQEQQEQSNVVLQQENINPSLLATVFNFSTFGKSIRTIIVIVFVVLVIYLIIMFWKRRKKNDVQQNPNIKNGQWK